MAEKSKGSGKFFVYGGILVVAVIIVIFAVTGFPPSEDDVSGTIGAAKKYRAEQIKESDVLLDHPELQELLQNDKVLELLQDEEFRRMIADDDFGALMQNPVAVELMFEDVIHEISVNKETAPLLLKDEYAMSVANEKVCAIGNVATFSKHVSEDKQLMELFRDNFDLQRATESEGFYKVAREFSIFEALVDRDILELVRKQSGLSLLADPKYVPMLEQGNYEGLLEEEALREIFKDTEFGRMHEDAVLNDFLKKSTSGENILSDHSIASLLSKEKFILALRDPTAKKVLLNRTFRDLARNAEFRQALSKNMFARDYDISNWTALKKDAFLERNIDNVLIAQLFEDVKVGQLFEEKPVQKLLEMSMFEKVASSPNSLTSLAKLNKLSMLARSVAKNPAVYEELASNTHLLDAFVDPKMQLLVGKHRDIFNLSFDPDIRTLWCSKKDLQALASPEVATWWEGGNITKAVTDPRYEVLKETNIYNYAQDPAVCKVCEDKTFWLGYMHPMFEKIRSRSAYLDAFQDIRKISAKTETFRKMAENDDFNSVWKFKNFVETFKRSDNRKVVTTSAFNRLMTNLAESGA